MYFLDQWQNVNPTFPGRCPGLHTGQAACPAGSICHWAMASSLDATAWGIAFPDQRRVLFPPVVPRTDRPRQSADRRRLEAHEAGPQRHPPDGLVRPDSPGPHAHSGVQFHHRRDRPAAAVLARAGPPTRGSASRRLPGPQELLHLYPGARPRLSTAVRLSATFPFVSPICRALQQSGWPSSDAYHFCDGGYVDNEGMVTVIDWLRRLILDDTGYFPVADRLRAFDQVLLIRLMPFPSPAGPGARLTEGKGWVYSTIGPIEALQNVRGASQIERNHLAVELFTQAAAQPRRSRGGGDIHVRVSAPGASAAAVLDLDRRRRNRTSRASVATASLDGRHPNDPLGVVDQFFNRAEEAMTSQSKKDARLRGRALRPIFRILIFDGRQCAGRDD